MSFSSLQSKKDDYFKEFRERVNQIKISKASPKSKPGNNSINRIAEFRKKLESSFNTRSEQCSNILADDSFKSYSKELIAEVKKCPSPGRYQAFGSFCKSPSIGSSSFIQKTKLEEAIPFDTLVEAKNSLLKASEEGLKDLPDLYAFTLTRLSKNFCDKFEKNRLKLMG